MRTIRLEISMDQLTPEERRAQEMYARLVASELAAGNGKAKIAEKLMREGCPDYQTAISFINDVERAMNEYGITPESRASASLGQMMGGCISVVIGLAISVGSYLLSETIGVPFFLVAGGAIIFGLYSFFRGLFGFLTSKP